MMGPWLVNFKGLAHFDYSAVQTFYSDLYYNARRHLVTFQTQENKFDASSLNSSIFVTKRVSTLYHFLLEG